MIPADIRLTGRSRDAGLQSGEALERMDMKIRGIEEIRQMLASGRVTQNRIDGLGADSERYRDRMGESLEKLMRIPEFDSSDLFLLEPGIERFRSQWVEQAVIDIKYEGYIRRQEKQINRFRRMENLKIPEDFDYGSAPGISSESLEKFRQIRPLSVGQASRISGVRSSDIAVLLVLLGKNSADA